MVYDPCPVFLRLAQLVEHLRSKVAERLFHHEHGCAPVVGRGFVIGDPVTAHGDELGLAVEPSSDSPLMVQLIP